MPIKQVIKSVGYAWKGMVHVFRHEQNFRIEIIISIGVMGLAFLVGVRSYEVIILLLLISLVLILELLNSALEKFVDILKPRLHLQVGIVKDIMAAMVLCASLSALVIGSIIFWPYIVVLLR